REEEHQFHRGVFFTVGPEVENEPDRIPQLEAFWIRHLVVCFRVASPHAQQEIHGNHGHFVEEEEKEQIQRHEHADRGGGEDEQPDIKFFRPIFDVPGDENACEQQDARGQYQRGSDPIHTEVEEDTQLARPCELLEKLEASFHVIVGEEQIEGG